MSRPAKSAVSASSTTTSSSQAACQPSAPRRNSASARPGNPARPTPTASPRRPGQWLQDADSHGVIDRASRAPRCARWRREEFRFWSEKRLIRSLPHSRSRQRPTPASSGVEGLRRSLRTPEARQRAAPQPQPRHRSLVQHGDARRPARTMHEIRMGEVEIISMLMPAPARVSNIVAVTPGWVFMPAPTRETWATSSSAMTETAPSVGRSARRPRGRHDVVSRHGEGDVGRAVVRDVLHDHVDVDGAVRQPSEQGGGDARPVQRRRRA